MIIETYKELTIGDLVEYEDVYVHDKKRASGKGKIYGFGEFGYTPLVWVKKESGGIECVPYEKVKKI